MKHGSILILALISSAAAHGVERIRYEEIPVRLAPFGTTIKAYSIRVTTRDGVVHGTEAMYLQAAEVRLAHEDLALWETIASSKVARIEIRRGRRVLDFTIDAFWGGLFPVVGCFAGYADGCFLVPFVTPALVAVSAVSAPVTLAVDGIELLCSRPKVYEIIH